MASGALSKPVVSFEGTAQKVLGYLIGPYCVIGHALNLGFFVVDVKVVLGITLYGGIWYHWFYRNTTVSVHERFDNFPLRSMNTFGLDLILLSLTQYHDEVCFHMWLIVAMLPAIIFLQGQLNKWLFRAEDTNVPPAEETWSVDSIYEDPSKPMAQLVVIFALQTVMCIFALYTSLIKDSHIYVKSAGSTLYGILLNGDPVDEDNDIGTYLFWVVGFLVQMGSYFQRGSSSPLGRPWDGEKWHGLVAKAKRHKIEFQISRDEWDAKSERELQTRLWFNYIANSYYRDVIAFITPLVLLKSDDAMEVAQNALALAYIATLDDVSEAVLSFRPVASKVMPYRLRPRSLDDSLPANQASLRWDNEAP